MISLYIQNWLDVVENMKNDNTYKLAWGRSILETIAEIEPKDITISFDELSPKIIKYFWNQLYFFNLNQGSNKIKKPKIEQIVREMITNYRNLTASNIPVWYEIAEKEFLNNSNEYYKIINKVSNTLKENVCYRFTKIGDKDVQLYELDRNKKTISLSKNEVEDLQEYYFILSQLLNYRWAQLLEQYNTAPKIVNKVKGFSESKIKRSNLTKYKNILLEFYKYNPIDFYTGTVLEINDISVDHVIPWSFMYSDDIWNLVLTSKSNNSRKSNTVPLKEDIEKLNKRNENLSKEIKDAFLREKLIEAIDNHYVDKFYNSLKY